MTEKFAKDNSPCVLHMAGHWNSSSKYKMHKWAIEQIKSSNLEVEDSCDSNEQHNKSPIIEINPSGVKIDRLTIVLFSNYKNKRITQRSLERLNLNYYLLGQDVEKFNFKYKYSYIRDYLFPIIQTDYLLFLDAGDVFVTDDILKIIDRFESLYSGCKILFNAEQNRWPQKTNPEYFDFEFAKYGKESSYCYLNSGVYLANTEFLKTYIDEFLDFRCNRTIIPNLYKNIKNFLTYIRKGNYDDQEAAHAFHYKHFPKVQIDWEQKLFIVTTGID